MLRSTRMDRHGDTAYFGVVIRSLLTVLAAMALMFVSLTASADAARANGGVDDPIQISSISAPLLPGDTNMVRPCAGGGDLLCAFACAGLSSSAALGRPHAPFASDAREFFVAQTPQRAGRGPEQAERPPRP